MYDAIIIGSGPGGYSCALRIAALGGKAVLIERGKIGGTCVNTGCIPTKTLYAGAKIIRRMKKATLFGISNEIKTDFAVAMKHANETAGMLSKAVEQMLLAAKVEIIRGEAEISGNGRVAVGKKIYEGKNIVIAVGSKPAEIEIAKFDNKDIFSSSGIWNMETLPKSIAIFGGGPEGVEFANIFSAYGSIP
jgi:dihydrolipoamide dehydrogenase